MHEVLSNLLWIGHAHDIREPKPLFEADISAVIDIALEEPPAQLPRQLIYCRFPIHDGGGNDPSLLLHALQCTVDLLAASTRTIVACSAGISRSPTVAAFAVAAHLGQSPDDVILRLAETKALDIESSFWNEVARVYSRVRRKDS